MLCVLGAVARAGALEVSGEIDVSVFGYWEHSDRETRDVTFENDVKLTLTSGPGERLRVSLTPQLRYDAAGRADIGRAELLEDSPERPLLTLHEGALTWYGDTVEWAAGKRIYDWGVGDGFKPTDNLNPRDWVDVPAAGKIGVPSVSLYRYGQVVDAQVVVAPWFTPARLPGADNRWLVIDDAALDGFRHAFGVEPVVVDGGRELPGRSLENAQAGARLSSSALLSGWDLAVAANVGHESIGVIRGDALLPELVLTVVYPEYQEVGAGASTTWGEWEVHAEAAYHRTEDERQDDDYVEYVAGVNRTWHDTFLEAVESVTLTLEYAGEAVTRSRPDDSAYVDAVLARGLTGTVLGRTQFRFTEDCSLEVAGAVNVEPGDFRLRSGLTVKPLDGVELEAGVDLFEGPCDSFFGGWDNNDRVFVLAALSF